MRAARPLAAALGLAFCGIALGQPPAPASPPAERPMPLEVVVNGARSGTWLLIERGGVLYAPREAFEDWRLELRPGAPAIEFQGQRYIALSAIPGFKSRIDFANQSVELLFSPEAFATLRMTRELARRPAPSPVVPSLFLNYDASFSSSDPRSGPRADDLGVLSEVGFSSQAGVLTMSSVARNLGNDRDLGVKRQWLRLETTFTRDFPDRNRTLRVGDTTTRAAMWGRDVYFGGVRFGTNFALTPGFVSQPLPAVRGLSAAPSTVELYVNDVLRQVSSVPTGPFVIDNFPLLSGSGEARIVVRDLLGRETVVVQPFFSSARLLAPGLDDWSVEAGRVRRGLGVASNDYGERFAAATWRRGLSNQLTVEGRAEATRRLRLVGAGMLNVLPWHVVARAALVASHESTLGSGGHWLLGLEHQGLRTSASLEVSRSSAKFREVGQELLLAPLRYQIAGNWTYSTESVGTFGLGFASIARHDGSRISTVSGNYSVRLARRSNLTVTASRALEGGTGSAIGITFLVPLDAHRVGSVTANRRSGKTDLYAAAVQNPGIEGDLGWRALAGMQQDEKRAEGGLYYQGQRVTLTADASVAESQRALRVGASGGLVFAEGHLFATRRVEDSFAIAEVPGYADIGIGIGSNVLARTNEDGVALVPRLLPYMPNSVRIDPRELPINAEIESIEQTAVPAWRSGVKVQFPVRSGRGALIRIVLPDGQVAPAGAVVSLRGDKEEFYVARRGEAFVTGLKPVNRLRMRWGGRECGFDVTLPPPKADEIPRIGPVTCKEGP